MTTATPDAETDQQPRCGAIKDDGEPCQNMVSNPEDRCGHHADDDVMSREELEERKQDLRAAVDALGDRIEETEEEIEEEMTQPSIDDQRVDNLQDALDRLETLRERRSRELEVLQEQVEPEVERRERREEVEDLLELAHAVVEEAEDAREFLEESLPELKRAARVVGVAGGVAHGLRKAVRNISSRLDLDVSQEDVPLPDVGPAKLQGFGKAEVELLEDLAELDLDYRREGRNRARRIGFRGDRPDDGIKAARQQARELLEGNDE